MFSWLSSFLYMIVSYMPMFSYTHVDKLHKAMSDFSGDFNASDDVKNDSKRRSNYTKTTEMFYNLITDFYEWGWGRSFHFAPRYENESFEQSIVRYEHFVGSQLGVPTDKTSLSERTYNILDVGCGVGGPMRSMMRFFKSRVHFTGINITQEHIARCDKYNKADGFDNYTLVVGDFNKIPRPDSFFDGIYDFEATLHSIDRLTTFKEIFRVLKPGGKFVSAQYTLLDKYDADNEYHRDIIRRVDNTNGCYCSDQTTEITTKYFEQAGFKVVSVEDVFHPSSGDVPFHEVFESSRGQRLTGTKFGLWCTYAFTYFGEMIRLLPKGTCEVQSMLMGAAESFKEAGREGILTPGMLYTLEKPIDCVG